MSVCVRGGGATYIHMRNVCVIHTCRAARCSGATCQRQSAVIVHLQCAKGVKGLAKKEGRESVSLQW